MLRRSWHSSAIFGCDRYAYLVSSFDELMINFAYMQLTTKQIYQSNVYMEMTLLEYELYDMIGDRVRILSLWILDSKIGGLLALTHIK